jgi:hypothetical protein
MGKEYICDIITMEAVLLQGFVERVISMKVIMPEEFRVLFIANAIVYQDQPFSIFDQEAAHCPAAEIELVSGIELVPDGFGNNAEHSASIELEISSVDRVEFHGNE